MRKLAAESADGRGRVAEEMLLDAVRKVGAEIEWFVSARAAELKEDCRGIDIVVTTRDGRSIYLQSKSSRRKALSFQSKKREDTIAVIVVSMDERSNECLAKEAMEKLYVESGCGIDVDS
jgi:ADP-heptose:LPS heptosyltransferase